jgi:hypothetical protein
MLPGPSFASLVLTPLTAVRFFVCVLFSTHDAWSGDDVWIIKGKGPSAGGVRVHDASVDHPHRGAEWTPGRQQEFVDKYGIAAKWGRASCPTGIAEE